MTITLCGSMAFASKMTIVKRELEKHGHTVFIPKGTKDYANNLINKSKMSGSEGTIRKIVNDLIRKHCYLIKNSDAILVLNYEKGGIANYIGGNSFLEIGYAYILGKKIFLMNNIPNIKLIRQEVEAMQPTIISNNLKLIH